MKNREYVPLSDIEIARVCHEALKEFCSVIGVNDVKPWNELTEPHKEVLVSGVRDIRNSPELTPREIHEVWMKNMLLNGYVLGDKKCHIEKTHPMLVSFDHLDEHEKEKDVLFYNIVRALA